MSVFRRVSRPCRSQSMVKKFERAEPVLVPDDWEDQLTSEMSHLAKARPPGAHVIDWEAMVQMRADGVLEYSLEKAFKLFETAITTPSIVELLEINARHYFSNEEFTYPEPSMATRYVRFLKWFSITQNNVTSMSLAVQNMFYADTCNRPVIDFFMSESIENCYALMSQKYNDQYLETGIAG